MSSVSLCGSADGALVDPRVERLKRSETLSPLASSVPIPPPKDAYTLRVGLKRAPSYGAVKQVAKVDRQKEKEAATMAPVMTEARQPRHERKLSSGSHISSDEEEKSRSKRVKKSKTTSSRSSTSPVPSSPISVVMGNGGDTAPSSPVDRTPLQKTPPNTRGKTSTTEVVESKNVGAKVVLSPRKLNPKSSSNRPSTRPLPMNLQRNPSMFGAELPPLPTIESSSGPATDVGGGKGKSLLGEKIRSSVPAKSKLKSPSSSPDSPTTRTLRRVKRLDLGFGFGLGARKIEFGNSDAKTDQENKKAGNRNMLESAIHLA